MPYNQVHIMLRSFIWHVCPKALVITLAVLSISCTSNSQIQNASTSSHFDIVNNKWMSLHHFAYHTSRALSKQKLRGRVPLYADDIASFDDNIKQSFMPVAEAYTDYINTSLLHNQQTRAITKALFYGPKAIPDENLKKALIDFMPIYEREFWPRHKRNNEDFINRILPELDKYETIMSKKLAQLLESQWPADKIRVDVVPYANWAGAYTNQSPNNITISSRDPDISAHAFEVLFHEASHTSPLGDNIEPAATLALTQYGVSSQSFWHHLLFFVAAQATQQTFGDVDYISYTDATGLSARPKNKDIYSALESTWDSEKTLKARARATIKKIAKK